MQSPFLICPEQKSLVGIQQTVFPSICPMHRGAHVLPRCAMGRRPSGRWNRNVPGTSRSLRRNLTVAAKVLVGPQSLLGLQSIDVRDSQRGEVLVRVSATSHTARCPPLVASLMAIKHWMSGVSDRRCRYPRRTSHPRSSDIRIQRSAFEPSDVRP